jgi:parallel beta-helix repeat protein
MWEKKKVNTSKVIFLVVLTTISLCAVNTQPVNSQSTGIIYILSDGSIYSSTGATVPIQQDENLYTFTGNLVVYSFVVQRSNITIDGAGFAFGGEGEIGIELTSVNTVTIKNIQVNGMFYYGIYIGESSSITLTENTIENNGSGIVFYNSSYNTISGNNITNNEIGIELRYSSNNIFRNNRMNNTHNIAVYGNEASHFINDFDDSNTINNKKIYYLVGEENLVISPETFPDVGFLALVNCTNITVQQMELTSNVEGILLVSTTSSTIAQNKIRDNRIGIMLFASSSNIITGNSITENYRGVQLSMFSTSNSISANNITDNVGGLFLYNSSYNTISGNNITNEEYGLGLSSSSYNMIRGNYFINNSIQVYDASTDDSSVTASMNSWYVTYPVGGNYWSDYTGVDARSGSNQNQTGSDKIGDTPYIIDKNNKDNYPLMPYGSPPYISIISPENKTYTANSVSLTFTVSKTTTLITYSLDGQTNITINGDTTLSDLSKGLHSITVYAQDTDGKMGASETIYFTIAEGSETPLSEFFPITLIVAVIVLVVVVGVILFYFLRTKKK